MTSQFGLMIGKRNGDHRQRDPAGPDSEQQALALAVRNGRFGEFLGVLLGVGSPCRSASKMGDISRFRQCAQDTRPQIRCIG